MSTDDETSKNKLPSAIAKTVPKLTLEMPGPYGDIVRRRAFDAELSKDHQNTTAARAKKLADKDKERIVVSREQVREGIRGILSPHFNKIKDRGGRDA